MHLVVIFFFSLIVYWHFGQFFSVHKCNTKTHSAADDSGFSSPDEMGPICGASHCISVFFCIELHVQFTSFLSSLTAASATEKNHFR